MNSKVNWTPRQKEILENALILLTSGSIDALSIRAIADKIGISEPAIYRHFKSKEELLMSVASIVLENWEEIILKKMDPTLPAIDQFEELIKIVFSYFEKNSTLADALFQLVRYKDYETISGIGENVIELVLVRFVEFLTAAKKEKALKPNLSVNDIAFIIFSTFSMTLQIWCFRNQSEPLSELWKPRWSNLRKMILNEGQKSKRKIC